MHIAKILAGAAMISAPLSLVAGQSSAPTDSGNHSHHGEWLAGTGTAAGAALFLAFTQSGHGGVANSNTFAPQAPQVPQAPAPQADPTGGPTPPPNGGSTPTPPGPTTTPPPPGSGKPPAAGDDGPIGRTNDGPTHYDTPSLVMETSTVPEPGTFALTATGIIGLVPLIRRRRR